MHPPAAELIQLAIAFKALEVRVLVLLPLRAQRLRQPRRLRILRASGSRGGRQREMEPLEMPVLGPQPLESPIQMESFGRFLPPSRPPGPIHLVLVAVSFVSVLRVVVQTCEVDAPMRKRYARSV